MSQIKGCPTPRDEDDDVSHLQEDVLAMLERAQLDSETSDAIMKLIENAERRQNGQRAHPLSMRLIAAMMGFDPTNHHNAAGCPYCTQK